MFNKKDVKDIYELSPMQLGMLYHYIANRQSNAYVEQVVLSVSGEIDVSVFEAAFNALVKKYDILRTVFLYEKVKRPLQVVLHHRSTSVDFRDISAIPEPGRNETLEMLVSRDQHHHFQLDRDIPMRVTIVKTQRDRYKLLWTSHHIITDGWCIGIILKDFNRLYNLLLSGETVDVEPAIPYSRYIKWLGQQDRDRGLRFWHDYLEGYNSAASIPRRDMSVTAGENRTEAFEWSLDESLTRLLEERAGEQEATVNILFQVAWGLLLQQYNTTDDAVFGSVVSGRPAEINGIEEMVGLFINTVPVRITYHKGQNFTHLIHQNREQKAAAAHFEYLPLADIQAGTPLNRELLDHILVFENYPIQQHVMETPDDTNAGRGFRIDDVQDTMTSNYDLNVIIIPGKRIQVRFVFNASVYDPGQIRDISRHFVGINQWLVANPDSDVCGVDFITHEERTQLLEEFNNTCTKYPVDKTIHQLFDEQASRTPHFLALVQDEKGLTYFDLSVKANRLASLLRDKGAGPGSIVSLKTGRSIEMVVGMLGILKSGAAYLPIDPNYPMERIDYMLNDSNTGLMVVSLSSEAGEPEFSKKIECIQIDNILGESAPAHLFPQSPAQLCYVIYTSGSTGRPKGVLVEHRSVVNTCSWHNDYYTITEEDRVSQLISPGFDASVQEIFPCLMSGASLHIIDEAARLDPVRLNRYFEDRQLTVGLLPAPLFRQFVEIENCSPSLRLVISGGDRMLNFKKRSYSVYNNYGPTENSVVTTSFKVLHHGAGIPIGPPIANNVVYVLRPKQMQLQPVGVAGELCIGGVGLARGYLNNPELTAEKFCHSTLNAQHITLYRTGDLARWLSGGNLEFLGRIDRQVKIRGFRIELAEIEHCLLMHESIRDVVVTPVTRGDETCLCSYVVFKTGSEVDLTEFLSRKLPGHMIPAFFIPMAEIPLTPNSKVDTSKLPEPSVGLESGKRIPPQTETEIRMTEIWAEILGVDIETIGIGDDFFRVGGHSLKAMTLINTLHKTFDRKISIHDLFQYPTIEGLARFIEKKETSIFERIEKLALKPYYELSFTQKRLWVLQKLEPGSAVFNMPMQVPIPRYSPEEEMLIRKVLSTLTARHDSFRTRFKEMGEEIVQVVEKETELPFDTIDLTGLPENLVNQERSRMFNRESVTPFNIETGPLWGVKLVKYKSPDAPHLQCDLIFNMHHIISDGWSMDVLHREFMDLYRAFKNDDKDPLEPMRIQYRDYAAWQNRLLQDRGRMADAIATWKRLLSGELPVLKLPYSFTGQEGERKISAGYRLTVPGPVTGKLQEVAARHGASLFMVLLAVFQVFLSQLRDQEDIIMAIPGAARRHEDLKNVVGAFVNTLILRSRVNREQAFPEFLADVRENTLSVLEHQGYPMELIFEELNIPYPEINVFLNMLNIGSEKRHSLGDPEPCHIEQVQDTKFDILCYLTEFRDGIEIICHYFRHRFRPAAIEKLMQLYVNLLERIAHDPGRPLKEYRRTGKKRTFRRN